MRDEIPPSCLSHKERYEVSIRKAVHMMSKVREMMQDEPLDNFREEYL